MSGDKVQPIASAEVIAPNPAESIPQILAELAEHETRFTERFYEIFFEARPDARPLFGTHALAEQEEMMRETLHSLLAWAESEPWLEGNLSALGKSHWEYGVTADMYASFIESMLECGNEVIGESLDADQRAVLRSALEFVAYQMRDAGDAAEAADTRLKNSRSEIAIKASG